MATLAASPARPVPFGRDPASFDRLGVPLGRVLGSPVTYAVSTPLTPGRIVGPCVDSLADSCDRGRLCLELALRRLPEACPPSGVTSRSGTRILPGGSPSSRIFANG